MSGDGQRKPWSQLVITGADGRLDQTQMQHDQMSSEGGGREFKLKFHQTSGRGKKEV